MSYVIDENFVLTFFFFLFASALALFLSSFFLTFNSFFLSEAVFYSILFSDCQWVTPHPQPLPLVKGRGAVRTYL